MIPEAGQRFGPYEILGRLGGGGMGLVFRAWDERLHREVAVKLLHDDYRMPGMRERFLQEARAASALNHPHICTIFDIGEQDGVPYLVMEQLEGETVKDRIAHGALPVEEIVRYGQEIAEALAVAHAKGIVHRDIKPANIFLVAMPNGKSEAKVLDFGLAKIGLDVLGGWQSRTLDLTLAGATVGTLAYMSPEQARGESLDARSDLFSLGIVMYEMATRRVPFKGTTSALIFVDLLNHDPEPVRSWNESVPRELERVILKLLAKDRRGRFQTAKELHEALSRMADKMGRGSRWLNKGSATAVPLVRASDPVARQKRKRKTTDAQGGVPGEVLGTAESRAPVSSADNMLIRPVRMPEREREGAVFQPAKQNALALESELRQMQPGVVQGVAAQSDSSAAAAAARASKRAAKDAQAARREPVLARSGSGATQFEYGLDDPVTQDSPAEDWVHARATETLVESTGRAGRGVRVAAVAVSVLVAMGGVFWLVHSGLLRPMVLGPKDRLLLTVIQNKTGDRTLDGTVTEGMEIALRQSAALNVLGEEAYSAGLRQIEDEGGGTTASEQMVAERAGAKAYLYGEIKGSQGPDSSQAPYTISMDVLRADSNDKVDTLEETVGDREQIPAAIGRLAQAARAEVGDREGRRAVSLEQDATANVNALHAYALGESAMQSGRVEDALKAYQQAVALDPKFVQAQMRLAWLYRAEKAEVAAANAAELAHDAAVHASGKVKLLAQFCYEMNTSGDYGQATETIRQYVAKYPLDVEGMKGLARVLRLQGYLPEALLAAQQGYGENPFDAEMYGEAELAMIGMDRDDGVLRLQAQRMGVVRDENVLAVEYPEEKAAAIAGSAAQGTFAGAAAAVPTQLTYAESEGRGLSLDNAGRMSEGLELWRAAAAKATEAPELASTAAYMLAQGALDRALVESCPVALEMVNEVRELPKGPIASFHAGMAAALCGDKTYADKVIAGLQQRFPRSTAVTQYYVPELEAAADVGVNEPAKALQVLAGMKVHEEISLVPYLRGLAHSAAGQMPLAVADFQTVLAHRGLALMVGSSVYPMAEIGVARAYAANGDKADSVAAYRRFLASWGEADRTQPRMVEALAKSR